MAAYYYEIELFVKRSRPREAKQKYSVSPLRMNISVN